MVKGVRHKVVRLEQKKTIHKHTDISMRAHTYMISLIGPLQRPTATKDF